LHPENYEATEAGWRAWLVILDVRMNKRIKSQENRPFATGSLPKTTETYLGDYFLRLGMAFLCAPKTGRNA